jgi:hypothetical protein
MDKEPFMKSLSIKTILFMVTVTCFSFGLHARTDDQRSSVKAMSLEERTYCISLVRQFETEFIFLHGQATSFIQLWMVNEKGQKLLNKTAFRKYVTELSCCVDRFEKQILEDVVNQMARSTDHDSGFYQSLVIVYDSCSKLLPPLQVLRSVLMKYVSATDKNQMAKKIAKDIEESLLKLPLTQTWNSVTMGFTRLKALMVRLGETEILEEISLVENRLEKISQSFSAMNISVTTIIAALDQKLRNNKA